MTHSELTAMLPSRLASRIKVDGDCLIWSGAHNDQGYPQVRWEGRVDYAHRVIYPRTCHRDKERARR